MASKHSKSQNYWLMKSEPGSYSIDDLARENVAMWDGVRNYQVRNMIRDELRVGDVAFFYHSNAGSETGVVGRMQIEKAAYPDPTQFDPESEHPDPKSDPENPRWLCVDVRFVAKFPRVVTLSELKDDSFFNDMLVTQKGSRLSIQPVAHRHFDRIVKMAHL